MADSVPQIWETVRRRDLRARRGIGGSVFSVTRSSLSFLLADVDAASAFVVTPPRKLQQDELATVRLLKENTPSADVCGWIKKMMADSSGVTNTRREEEREGVTRVRAKIWELVLMRIPRPINMEREETIREVTWWNVSGREELLCDDVACCDWQRRHVRCGLANGLLIRGAASVHKQCFNVLDQ
ncbi:hypothetical protein Sjap_017636 [Stephania japonica]|uniref:Uncharacterized protein n=1 Tax=Stephania japonica TaxID=461633 RepID=A0AAP0I6S3_9MAGN